jgi:hypothetical protein
MQAALWIEQYLARQDAARSRSYSAWMTAARGALVEDVHEIAAGMPNVKVVEGNSGNPVYQVGGKSFVFFRTPRPDARDPETGERYDDVIVLWVGSQEEKLALVQEPGPFFTTPHFNGHRSVLVRASQLHELSREELAEVIQDAWLSQASKTRRTRWLAANQTDT